MFACKGYSLPLKVIAVVECPATVKETGLAKNYIGLCDLRKSMLIINYLFPLQYG